MDTTRTTSTPTRDGNADLDSHSTFDTSKAARNYGVFLGVITAVYLIVINAIFGTRGENGIIDVPLGLRFAKHLLLIPVVWIAFSAYAKTLPGGKIFKNEIGYLMSIGMWSALTIAVLNVIVFMISPSNSFEQFMQEGNTFAGVMVNSVFLIFEHFVFVMTFGFILMQAYKSGGSPEDPDKVAAAK